MKKDIKFLPVENIYIAVVRDKNELNEFYWNVYLINKNDYPLSNVFIRSKGYGTHKGDEQQTSALRHHFELVEAKGNVIIEPIDPSVFHLNNEYWLSYYANGQIFDKKFIFVPDSIVDTNLIEITELGKEGVLHS